MDAADSGDAFGHGQAPSLKHCLEVPHCFYLGTLGRPELTTVNPNDSALKARCLQIGGVNISLSHPHSVLWIMFLSNCKIMTIGIYNIKMMIFCLFDHEHKILLNFIIVPFSLTCKCM